MKKRLLIGLAIFFCFGTISAKNYTSIVAVSLACELRDEALGVDVANPSFGFTLSSVDKKRGQAQSAFRLLVSSSQNFEGGGNMWDSKKVSTNQMAYIKYKGKTLQSTTKYWWKVMVWDQDGNPSNWSQITSFTTGILLLSDWKADWISTAGAEKYAIAYQSAHTDFNLKKEIGEMRFKMPTANDANFSSVLLRKDFLSPAKLKVATIHISGLGHYELSINGTKVGDQLLAPGWSEYKKTVLYDTYDVTQMIKNGNNAIGIILGNGMYNIQPDSIRYVKFLNSYGPLKVLVQLKLEYDDGSVKIIVSDKTWQVSAGPITYSNEFGGEDFDARLVENGWDSPGFNGSKKWTSAIECQGPGGELKGISCAAPPIKAIEKIEPVNITKHGSNILVYDFGQNASMMPNLNVVGEKGAYVRMIPSELIDKDGLVDRRSCTQDGVRPAWWQYTLDGKGSEKYCPKFFYQGARYLQVELYPGHDGGDLPKIEALKDVVLHSSSKPIGSFVCSNELFNKIYTLVRWAQRSNMMSYMTDCPHREKMGWLEEDNLNGPALRYNFDMAQLFRKAMNDMADAQMESGFVPNIAPEYFTAGPLALSNGFRNSPEWGSSFIIVPWQQYLFSGDISLLERYYEKMKKYVGFLSDQAKNNIISIGLGDWYDIGPKESWGSQLTPPSFTATSVFYYDNVIMQNIAGKLGKLKDADAFKKKAEEIRTSFNTYFYNPATGLYATGSQTTCAMPLFFNLVQKQNRKRLLDSLVSDIQRRNNSFTSGEVGYRFLLKALADGGKSNVVFDINNQSEKPGYGFQLKKGATSLTEKWDAGVGSFGSQNHFMSGQINEWFFNNLIGIGPDETGAGFSKFIVKPVFLKQLDWVEGSYASTSGNIICGWKRSGEGITFHLSVPINTTAKVYLPNKLMLTVEKALGAKFLKIEEDNSVYQLQSGDYQFSFHAN